MGTEADPTYIALMKKSGLSDDEIDAKLAKMNKGKAGSAPEIPLDGNAILEVFQDLSRSRGATQNGPLPITFLEIKAYCELYDLQLDPVELNIIQHMDSTWLDEVGKELSKQLKK